MILNFAQHLFLVVCVCATGVYCKYLLQYYHILFDSAFNVGCILVRLNYRPYKELSLKGVVFQSKKRGWEDIELLKTKVM